MEHNSTLEELSLSGNTFGDSGIKMLMEHMTQSASCPVVKLDLSGNQIGDDGADKIADMLKANRTVRIFHLVVVQQHFKNGSYILEQRVYSRSRILNY